METEVTTATQAAGDVTLFADIFGLEPRPDIRAAFRHLAARKRRRCTHDVKNRQRSPHRGALIARRVPTRLGPSRPSEGQPVVRCRAAARSAGVQTPRSHAIVCPEGWRVLALKPRALRSQGRRIIFVLDKASMKEGKTKALQSHLDNLGLKNALFTTALRWMPASHGGAHILDNRRCTPGPGITSYYSCASYAVLTKAALERWRHRFHMSSSYSAPLRREHRSSLPRRRRSPSTQPGDFTVAAMPPAQIRRPVGEAFFESRSRAQHARAKGKVRPQGFRRYPVADQARNRDAGRGHTIDLTTGL